ncbi:MAG: poly(R)-hydroxyalkanoic acid synthase subunit PhaE [Pseudomonadota bacterium]
MSISDHMGSAKDMLSAWTSMPMKLTEQWMKMFRSFSPSPSSSSSSFFPWSRPTEQKNLPFDNMGMYDDWMKRSGETMQRIMQMAPSGIGPETFFKVFDGMKSYFSLHEFWGQWVKAMEPLQGKKASPEMWTEVQEKMAGEYKKVLDVVIGQKPPETMEQIMKMHEKTMSQGTEFMGWMRTPWESMSKTLPDVATRALAGDVSAAREGMSLWQTAIADTIGKLLNIPSLGYSRQYEERNKQLMDAYLKFATALPAFYSEFQQTGMKAYEKIFDNARDIPAEHSPESFKKFYTMWLQTNEDTFFSLFRNAEFVAMMNEVLNKGLDFKKRLDDNTSKYLESLNIPNREEINDVYKALYDVKKELRMLSREVMELKEQKETKNK